MIPIKSKKEIGVMNEGGRILAKVVSQVINNIRPGVKTKELDALAEELLIKNKAKPSFKMVKGYHWASCININNGLVHGIPGNYRIKNGDIATIDLGAYFKGFHTDMARTLCVRSQKAKAKRQNDEKERFLKVGKLALKKAVVAARPGNYLGHLSKIIQETIESAGYSCSRKFTGHGIGRKLHEEPRIPCFLEKKTEETPKLKEGMVLAIEVIYTEGAPAVKILRNGWTAKTIDGKLGGLFEDTVAVTKVGSSVLTMV